MPEPPDREQSARLLSIGSRLRLDSATAEVLRKFESGGIGALLLKGPSISRWLYHGRDPRSYRDCDLLVAPADAVRAEHMLESLGFERYFDDRRMPVWWREHAREWVRGSDGVTVDLHRRLWGAAADPQVVWSALMANADRVLVAGYRAPTLSRPALALQVALHAAHHGVSVGHPLQDLQLALETADEKTWLRAALLAADLDAIDAFATGLRLTELGTAVAERLRLPRTSSVSVQLLAGSPPPVALGIEQLARARGARAKAAILGRKLVPPPAFIKHWDPRAREGRRRLVRAYLRRPIWLLHRAPGGVRAWRAARRQASGRTDGRG